MEERRCYNCKRLLYKSEGKLESEVICPGCRRINYFGQDNPDIGLRGRAFQTKAVDHYCPKCNRLMMRTIGYGIVEVVCLRCGGKPTLFDTKKMRTTGETSTKLRADLTR